MELKKCKRERPYDDLNSGKIEQEFKN